MKKNLSTLVEDIYQTVTNITVNQPITLSTPVYIKGANSGATAWLKDSVSAGVGLTVYETEGNFIENEATHFTYFDEIKHFFFKFFT